VHQKPAHNSLTGSSRRVEKNRKRGDKTWVWWTKGGVDKITRIYVGGCCSGLCETGVWVPIASQAASRLLGERGEKEEWLRDGYSLGGGETRKSREKRWGEEKKSGVVPYIAGGSKLEGWGNQKIEVPMGYLAPDWGQNDSLRKAGVLLIGG